MSKEKSVEFPKINKIEYEITEKYSVSDTTGRWASIFFVDGEFDYCEESVSRKGATLEDWHFLKIVADKILELSQKKGGKK